MVHNRPWFTTNTESLYKHSFTLDIDPLKYRTHLRMPGKATLTLSGLAYEEDR